MPSLSDPIYSFYQHLDALIEQDRLQGAAACLPGVARRPWNMPPLAPTNSLDIDDPAFWVAACDRSSLNSGAVAAYETGREPNAGRTGTVMAYKKAIDYQACYERALRARHASPVQLRVWAMARRTGHGSPTYGVFGVVKNEIDVLLDEATATDNSPR